MDQQSITTQPKGPDTFIQWNYKNYHRQSIPSSPQHLCEDKHLSAPTILDIRTKVIAPVIFKWMQKSKVLWNIVEIVNLTRKKYTSKLFEKCGKFCFIQMFLFEVIDKFKLLETDQSISHEVLDSKGPGNSVNCGNWRNYCKLFSQLEKIDWFS